jgi:hypothetical protein
MGPSTSLDVIEIYICSFSFIQNYNNECQVTRGECLPLPGIEPLILGRPGRSLVAILSYSSSVNNNNNNNNKETSDLK